MAKSIYHSPFTVYRHWSTALLSYLLYGLFILACIVLVVVILLQPGKSGAGDLFSSSVSSTAFGPRGTASILAKITIGAAAAFMLIALTLSLPGVTGTRSVLQSEGPEATPTPAPVASPVPSVAPAAPPAASPAASPTGSQ
ncbi:MAG TPA: preprotein translocase subunit SecG [Pyrinomonadaceae bacterium]|nr:preprotein translocase subunit SecG [Pyrinomonadaceae bacterium]